MSNRLYVGNLPFHATEELLSQRFTPCGGVVSVSVVTDRETGRSRGFAFVEMESAAAAQKAIAELDGQDMEGRALRVRIAEDRKPGGGGGFRGGGGGGGFGGGGYRGGGGGGGGGGGYRDGGGRGGGGRRGR
jgi:RNA recognition motif-containing protein